MISSNPEAKDYVKKHCAIKKDVACEVRKRLEYSYNELALLFDISCQLNNSGSIIDVLPHILSSIKEKLHIERGMITIFNRKTLELKVVASTDLTEDEMARGHYNLGEGVIGEVAESGETIVIPNIESDTRFLNRTGSRSKDTMADWSYACVPLKNDENIVGTLSCDVYSLDEIDMHDIIRILSIIGTMIANSLSARQKELEEREHLISENVRLQDELKFNYHPDNIVGNSQKMVEIYKMIDTVAKANTTVIIRGESGVGKEGIAHAIHYHSQRANGPFIKVNCSALPESLIESELFGHEKGSFTGAVARRIGRFEMAHTGTIFLDEFGDLPLTTQVKLLRVLQERTIERLGGTETISVDVRIICATNRDLEEQIKEGAFREDLYFRINIFPIYIPPLREHKTDIPSLVNHFIEKVNKRDNLKIKRICTSALDVLMQYHWPGNIRELENVIERAALLSRNGVIYGHQLPPSLQAPAKGNMNQGPLDTVLTKMEKELILDALKYTKGNITRAAEVVGISERMMGIRIKKYKIDSKKFKTTHGYNETTK